MKKLKSTNLYYLIGILPLLLLAFTGGILLAGQWWVRAALILCGIVSAVLLIRKFSFLPRPRSEYLDLKPLDLALPFSYCIKLYTSARMAKFPFLHRSVEVISPFRFTSDLPVSIAVNPTLLQDKGDQFTRMEVIREVEKYRRRFQVKSVLGLAVPLLTLLNLVEFIIGLGRNSASGLYAGFTLLGAPILAALVVVILFYWNKNISKQEHLLDKALLEYFTPAEVKQYILESEEILNREEKTKRRTVLDHYAQERIALLK